MKRPTDDEVRRSMTRVVVFFRSEDGVPRYVEYLPEEVVLLTAEEAVAVAPREQTVKRDFVTREYHMRVISALVAERNVVEAERDEAREQWTAWESSRHTVAATAEIAVERILALEADVARLDCELKLERVIVKGLNTAIRDAEKEAARLQKQNAEMADVVAAARELSHFLEDEKATTDPGEWRSLDCFACESRDDYHREEELSEALDAALKAHDAGNRKEQR